MQGRRRHKGFTLTEVLIVTGIVAVLGGIGIAVSSPAREKARQTVCASQLRQMHQAVMLYTADVDAGEEVPGLGPLGCGGLRGGLKGFRPYIKDSAIVYCPDVPSVHQEKMATSYVWMPVPSYFWPNPSLGEKGLLQQQALEIEKLGTSFPLWLCRTHDEMFYQPQEQHINKAFAKPFLIEVSIAGSISSGRSDRRRSRPLFH